MNNYIIVIYASGFCLTYMFLLAYCYGENEYPQIKELIGLTPFSLIWPIFWIYFIVLKLWRCQ